MAVTRCSLPESAARAWVDSRAELQLVLRDASVPAFEAKREGSSGGHRGSALGEHQ